MGRDPSIVVTGADGQVGRALRPYLRDARFLGRAQLDVTDGEAVARAVEGATCVIHAAAMTDVDRCEQEPERALVVNAVGARNVTRAAAETGARVLYLSTDHVFDGKSPRPHCETDPPCPINAYGRSKLEGESHVLAVAGNLVVRTSWVFGDGNNFVRNILRAARRGEELLVVDDQRGRPTSADALARALAALMGAGDSGVLHLAGEGEASRADLAEAALRAVGLDAPVRRVDTPTYTRRIGKPLAPRPLNGVLCLHKAKEMGISLEEWRTSVQRYAAAA